MTLFSCPQFVKRACARDGHQQSSNTGPFLWRKMRKGGNSYLRRSVLEVGKNRNEDVLYLKDLILQQYCQNYE